MLAPDQRLSLTGRRWVWPHPSPPAPADRAIPPWTHAILARRGIVDQLEQQQYLRPSLASLADPSQMADMDAAQARLQSAIKDGESITVFGDYDVDGVCSIVVLTEFLRQVGATVSFYVPDRCTEGYGLNQPALERLAQRSTLLVAVDCGINANEEIAWAKQHQLDVIVVDHHVVPAQLPAAVANLDPHRPDCDYPEENLCAAGVAFMLVAALRGALRQAGFFAQRPEPDVRNLLDLVALATVADMVPLAGANRTLVAAGLRQMAHTQRPGLRALLEVSGVAPHRVSATDLAFRLGPRINAQGRLGHAAEAVELLLTADSVRAGALAGELDQANQQRRDLESETLGAAVQRVERMELAHAPAIVLADPTWHPGVLGLVANRLASRFQRPAIVIGQGGKGSGRSVQRLDLHRAIGSAAHLLERFGGHAAAAGLTIAPEQVATFADTFADAVRAQLGAPPYVQQIEPDLEVAPSDLSLDMVADLQLLAPFGQKNPEPLLVARNLLVDKKRVVGQRHLKLRLHGHDAIGFDLGELESRVPERVDAAFRLTRNEFRGRHNLQLKIEDLRQAG